MKKYFFILLLMITSTVFAEVPSKEILKLTEQLQKNPTDDLLREKIIKLGLKIKPAPALPEEAERRMVRGSEAFKTASTLADYQLAAKEFEAATLAAPWYGDAYYNLGVAQDKSENFDAALKSLKFASLASPKSKDAQKLSYAVEFRRDKAAAPVLQKAKDDAIVKNLEGAVFTNLWMEGVVEYQYRISNGRAISWQKRLGHHACLCNEDNRCKGPVGEEMQCNYSFTLNGRHGENVIKSGTESVDISEDGKTLTWTWAGGNPKYIYNRR